MSLNPYSEKLHDPLDIQEVEKRNRHKCSRQGGKLLPFGEINVLWEAFKKKYRIGDELFAFFSSPKVGEIVVDDPAILSSEAAL